MFNYFSWFVTLLIYLFGCYLKGCIIEGCVMVIIHTCGTYGDTYIFHGALFALNLFQFISPELK